MHDGGAGKKLTTLAATLRARPDELRADFQQFYGLNLDDIGRAYTYLHAAALTAQLPRESRTVLADAPEAAWSDADEMMRRLEYTARVLAWQQTKDGAKGRSAPRPLPSPVEQAKVRRKVERTDVDEINRILGFEKGVC